MEKTILSLEKNAMERWRKGDPWGWVEISDDDIVYVDPSLVKPIRGLDEDKVYLAGIEGKVHYQGSEFIDPKIVVVGDGAVLTYNYRSSEKALELDSPKTLWNTTDVYFRRENCWKIVHSHWSLV